MVTIRIRDNKNRIITLTGTADRPITIRTKGGNASAMYLSADSDGLALSSVSVSYADWYNMFIAKKQAAMRSGGSHAAGCYNFNSGLINTYINRDDKPYIRTIGNCPPLPDGKLFILGSKYITLYPHDGQLKLGAMVRSNMLHKLLNEVYIFTWMLYHAYNYLMTRLVYYDPAKRDEMFGCLGRCGGTLLEYQAQLAIYNHKVWKSAYLCSVDTVVEKVAVGMGYVSQHCDTAGVLMLIKYSLTDAGGDLGAVDNETKIKIADAWNALTIFRSGKSVSVGGDTLNTGDLSAKRVVMAKQFSGESDDKIIHGTGYETSIDDTGDGDYDPSTAKVPDRWEDIQIAILLGPMERRQRYYEVFSLAVATGALKELQLPASDELAHRFKVEVSLSWYLLPDESAVDTLDSAMSAAGWYTGTLKAAADAIVEPIEKTTVAEPLAVNVTLPAPDAEGEE